MSGPINNHPQQHRDLTQENQRLRQQVEVLQQQLREQKRLSLDNQKTLSERVLRLVIDIIPQAVFWKDRNSVFLGCNHSLARLAGLASPEEIVGKTDYDLPWKPEETEFFRECDRRVMESGQPELGIIEPQLQSDGSQHWLETNKVPLTDDQGQVIGILGTFVDITQRHQAQLELQQENTTLATEFKARTQKLQATESRFQHLVANVPGVIYTFCLAPDGTPSFPYVSEKSREIYELEPENFLEVFDLIHPDDSDRVQADIQTSATTLERFDCEYRIITPSGTLKWLKARSQPEQQDNGDIIWDGIIVDISDRKAVEQALRESEAKYQQILDSFTDLVLVKGEKSRIVWANKAFRDYYAMSNETLQQLIDAPFNNPDYTQQYILDDQYVFETGKTLEIEEPVTRHDGVVGQFSTIKSAIRNEAGEVILTVGVSRDISDRQAAEAELRQQEAQYRQIFETISDGLGIFDLDEGKLVEVNPAYHQMHGYTREEFLALDFTDVVHPDSYDQIGQFIAEVNAGQSFTGQGKNTHRNGHVVNIAVKGLPFPYQGKRHALGIIRDISETVRLEQERDRQEQALRSIVEGTATQTGEAFFRACVKSLAAALEVSYVFIADIDRSQPGKTMANVIASWTNGDFGEIFQYDLQGTPCHNVINASNICRYAHSIQDLFPDDPYLVPLNAKSYIGIPLVNSQGMVVGLIAVLHTETIAESSDTQTSILEIFAARAGAEIERMRSEKALQEKERMLQLTLQAGKLGCWSWNQYTDEVIWSDGVEELFGLAKNSFNGTFGAYMELVHPEDREMVQQVVGQALATESEYHVEHRLLLPNGAVQWIRGRGEIWRNDQGEAIGLLGSVMNDTQKKLSELALVSSTEQLQQQARREQLLNQIANQIRTSLDLDRILETTVREIKQFLGVDRCHFAWHVHNETTEDYWDVIAEVRNGDLPNFMGQHPVANFQGLFVLLEQGEIVKISDVTTIDDPVLRQTCITLGNQSMLVLPVRSESGKLGIIACIHHQAVRPWQPEEVDFLQAVVAQVAIAINQSDLFAQSQARTQELEDLLVTLQRTQAQLVQSEKMSSLGQMVAGVAHEINNPISFIHGNLIHAREYMKDLLGLCDLYQQHYPDPHPDISDEIEAIDLEFMQTDMRLLFQSMNLGTQRIGDIVKSLRTFSRLDEATLKDVNLHDGLESTLMMLQARLRPQNWRPEIKVIQDYGDLPEVRCYAGELNQVFLNILSNAIDAIEIRDRQRTTTQMRAHASKIRIQTSAKTNHVVIAISDNGGGMSKETIARIFDPFFTTKTVGQGTGLGLAIAHQIITEQHNGQLSCTSCLEQGTTFTIKLPLTAES